MNVHQFAGWVRMKVDNYQSEVQFSEDRAEDESKLWWSIEFGAWLQDEAEGNR